MDTKAQIGVCGSGTMGIGIAQLAAANGHRVLLFDINRENAQKGIDALSSTLTQLENKGKINNEQKSEILGRIEIIESVNDFKEAEIIIEAIVENLDVKKSFFSSVEEVVSEDCILCSNTSSISITSIGSSLRNASRFLGLHFFNPAPVMPLVEIVPGLRTDISYVSNCQSLMETWNKVPVKVQDLPGFLVNRIARPFYGEALRIVEENIATTPEVDHAMKKHGGFKMGPFELMDLIGVDVNFLVTKTVYKDFFFDPKYKPSLLQQRMSEAGLLGRKSGKGFYNYPREEEHVNMDEKESYEIFLRIISMLVNEAVEAKRLKIASHEAIELAMTKGVNYPKGLLLWGEEIGYDKINQKLDELHQYYQEERYRRSPLLNSLSKGI